MQDLTVCLLNDSFPPVIDGVSNAVVNYAKNINEIGGKAIVAVPAYPGADDSGFPFPVRRYPSIDTRRLLGYVAGYPFSPEISAEIKSSGVEILHTHCPVTSCMLARSLRHVADAPLVLTYHTKFDIDIAKAIRGRLIQEGALRALIQNVRACDEVWVVSDGAGANLRSLGYEGPYTVMPNGVDIPRGRASDELILKTTSSYDLPQGVPVYLFVGRLMWYKGLRIILDALKTLKSRGERFRMVFIGDGADGEEVRAEAAGLDCIFTGAISDREELRAWYSRADLFLFPSTFDTNGLVVREAAACGTPSLLIRNSCASEGVSDFRNGFLIDENAESLAACLTSLSSQPDRVRFVGDNAQKELYISWESAVRRAYERYGTVIENFRSGLYSPPKGRREVLYRSQAELMEAFAKLESGRRGVRDNLVSAREGFREKGHELKAEIDYAKEVLWDRIDRYL